MGVFDKMRAAGMAEGQVIENAADLGRRGGRVVSGIILLGVIGFVLSNSFGIIQTGNIGVRTTLGTVSMDEVDAGIYFKWPLISTVREFSAKEVSIDLNDMTPKAKDNLSLRDLDLTVYFGAAPASIAELEVKYSNQSARGEDGTIYPAYELVRRVARNVAYEEVARIDSLVVHTRRDDLAAAVTKNIQAELEHNDPGVFRVSRVVVRAILTDPSIEQSIQQAVANQKKLEAMEVQTEIAKKEAEIKITQAKGIAESQRIIANSLTREYLQHETNEALMRFAEKGNTNTVIVPAGMNVAPLIQVGPGK
jgi:regulator of protease activity HflC (stomatin/prohibitin superfamily)